MIVDDRDNQYIVFDAHTHMGNRPIKSQVSASADVTAKEKIDEMNGAGVDLAVVFARANPSNYRDANAGIVEAMRSHPDRLVAYARVHPYFRESAAEDVARFAAAGVKGIKLHPLRDFSGNAVNDREIIFPIIAEAERHRLLVLIHSGNWWNCTPSLIGVLAVEFPGVNFVIAHCGEHGGHQEAIGVLKRLPNTYVDTADVYPPSIIANVVRAVGAERVLYGSDHPATPMRLEIEKVAKYCGLTHPELSLVLGRNLLRLLNMPVPEATGPVVRLESL
jgi:predicted TIM-barrel fold metal-dependent hydrolase